MHRGYYSGRASAPSGRPDSKAAIVTSQKAPRVLISRLSAVGDCVHTLPLACALRDRFPEATIGWVVQPGAAPLLKNHPAIDHTIVVRKGWLRDRAELRRLRDRLEELRFDVAVDPQSLTKSAMAGWLSGARRRIGFTRPMGREFGPWINNVRIASVETHVVDRYLELLQPLGVVAPRVRFDVPIDPEAQASVEAFIRRAHLGCGFAVLNPGAGWDSKIWPAGRYAQLARRLGYVCNLPSVVAWAGKRERAWADEIVEGSGGNALAAPSTSLVELAELLRRCRMFVGSDTGPLHLAAAVGTECVALLGPTRPEVCGPYGEAHVTVQAYYQGGSSRRRRGKNNEAMRAIEVDTVFDASRRILDRHACQATRCRAA